MNATPDGAPLRVRVSDLPSSSAMSGRITDARRRLTADLADRGVTLESSRDWTGLQAVNRANLADWFELMPKPASAPCLWVAAISPDGQTVATQAAYLLDCNARNFGERIANLTAFHDQPPDDEWSFCASEAAHDTMGRTAFTVAGWVRSDWRGLGLFHRMAFLVRLLAWEEWNPQWWVGLVDQETVPVWHSRGAGHPCLEDGRPDLSPIWRRPDQVVSATVFSLRSFGRCEWIWSGPSNVSLCRSIAARRYAAEFCCYEQLQFS